MGETKFLFLKWAIYWAYIARELHELALCIWVHFLPSPLNSFDDDKSDKRQEGYAIFQ